MKKNLIFLALAILVTAYIFSNSLQTAAESAEVSGGLLSRIIEAMPFLENILNHNNLRKMAHIAEFFTQGVFLSLWAVYSRKGLRDNLFLVAFWGLFTACCDELLQTCSVGRGPMVSDIFIDFTGTVSAVAVIGLIFCIGRRRKNVRL